jgi:histidinol dehydrogenase
MAAKSRDDGREQHWQTAKRAIWPELARESRRMRVEPTRAEAILWSQLRNRALGVRFRRQHVIDRFIVDFCCLDAKLIVEVDGPVHDGQQARDAQREAHLRAAGFRFLRIANDEVEARLESVIGAIREALRE